MDFTRIGLRMKQRRKALGLSLAEVGARVGTSASVIQRWENGETSSIKTTKLKAIAAALNTSVEYLLDVQNEFIPLKGVKPSSDDTQGELSIMIDDESMINARILPGDEVYVKRVKQFADGSILAVKYNNQPILRRVFSRDEGYELIPENPTYPTIRTNKLDIIGKATTLKGKIK